MFWPIQSIWARLFTLYLIAVGCIALVGSMRLVLILFPLSKVGRISLQSVCVGEVSPNSLADSALTGNLPEFAAYGGSEKVEIQSTWESSLRRTLWQANGRFRYICDKLFARTKVARGFVVLTLIVSVLVFVLNLSDVVRGAWAITNPVEPGPVLFRKNLSLSFGPLELGLLFCAILYVLSNIQEYALKRRQSKWEYFCARIQEGLIDGPLDPEAGSFHHH
jgi:hypothetical protein